jgi:acyl carrier protein phosphodiesterase
MNYLAHAYLSFGQPQLLVGNMISDFVKGRKKNDYPALIYEGIMLHRAIDNFTDTHSATKEARGFFRADYGLYSGAFIDIVYDHFLAKNESLYFPGGLRLFAGETYRVLEQQEEYLPDRFRMLLPHMKRQDWLFNYRFTDGIRNSFRGLVHRAVYMHDSSRAFEIFLENYTQLEMIAGIFLPDVERFAKEYYNNIVSDWL